MVQPRDILTTEQCQKFITLQGERLIVAKRQHWLVTVPAITLTIFSSFLFISLLVVVFSLNFIDATLLTISTLIVLIVMTSFLAKIIADWYYHLYIFTSKRIVEVRCEPLFSDTINDVLLDQVRITEIDAKIKGFVNELFDIGDVIISFDRPSHAQRFVIENVKDPAATGAVLTNTVKIMMESSPVWFQPRNPIGEYYKFTEDVEPNGASSVTGA